MLKTRQSGQKDEQDSAFLFSDCPACTFTSTLWARYQSCLCHACRGLCSLCPSPSLHLTNTIAPRADAETFGLIMTGLSQWWVCGVACVMSSWQGLLAWRLWRWVVALGEAGLNTYRTVSPGWWKNAKRFVGGVQRINLGSTLAHDCFIVPQTEQYRNRTKEKKIFSEHKYSHVTWRWALNWVIKCLQPLGTETKI